MDTALLTAFAFAFVIWHSYRMNAQRRRYWGTGLLSPTREWGHRVFSGLLAGAVLSVAVFATNWGSHLTYSGIWWIWGTALALGAVRLRWMAFSPVVGLVSLLALGSRQLVSFPDDRWIRSIVVSLEQMDVTGWLLLAGIIAMVNGVMIMWRGAFSYCPTLVPRRGRAVGAFLLQSLWAVPVFVKVADGWFVFPIPLVYSDLALSRDRQKRATFSGIFTVCYGFILAGLAFFSDRFTGLLWACALWAALAPEIIGAVSRYFEQKGTPKYTDFHDGIRLLDVAFGSPAAEMGLRPGEKVVRVNGQPVANMTDFYAALQKSPAYCKLEVVDRWGEVRIAQRALYAEDPHQLGIVPVTERPNADRRTLHQYGWWHFLVKGTKYKRPAPVTVDDSVHA